MSVRRWAAAAAAGMILGLVQTVPAHADDLNTQVRIVNRYMHPVHVVMGYKSASCNEWMVRGWFLIDSGETKHVANVDTNVFLYYAYSPSDPDNAVWAGGALKVNVPSNKFATCDNYLQRGKSSTRSIGMRLKTFTSGLTTYTMPLTP